MRADSDQRAPSAGLTAGSTTNSDEADLSADAQFCGIADGAADGLTRGEQGHPDASSSVKVCRYSDVPEDGAIAVEVDNNPVAVVRSGENLYAISDICSHAEVSLAEGEVYDDTIECWLHGSCFDLRSGKPTNLPATEPIETYRVQVEDGDVFVSLDSDD